MWDGWGMDMGMVVNTDSGHENERGVDVELDMEMDVGMDWRRMRR